MARFGMFFGATMLATLVGLGGCVGSRPGLVMVQPTYSIAHDPVGQQQLALERAIEQADQAVAEVPTEEEAFVMPPETMVEAPEFTPID
jgi:hypothetical protein